MDKHIIDIFIERFKIMQEENGLFLDLTEDKVRETYLETFPNGTNYPSFLMMLCNMTNVYRSLMLRNRIFHK